MGVVGRSEERGHLEPKGGRGDKQKLEKCRDLASTVGAAAFSVAIQTKISSSLDLDEAFAGLGWVQIDQAAQNHLQGGEPRQVASHVERDRLDLHRDILTDGVPLFANRRPVPSHKKGEPPRPAVSEVEYLFGRPPPHCEKRGPRFLADRSVVGAPSARARPPRESKSGSKLLRKRAFIPR